MKIKSVKNMPNNHINSFASLILTSGTLSRPAAVYVGRYIQMPRLILIVITMFLFSGPVTAGITDGGRGLLFGKDHAFAVTAIKGWVLDNQSGISQGLHMTFYPVGETWANSPVIIYGRVIPTNTTPTVEKQIKDTVRDFRNNGSPNYSSHMQSPLQLPNGKTAEIYHFTGDQWGNFEAVAYFKETDTINFLVFNSKTKENFDTYIRDFHDIARTYKNLYTSPVTLPQDLQNKLKRESNEILKKPGSKAYEQEAIGSVGQSLAYAMRDCTSYSKVEKLPPFSYFVKINENGNVDESYIFPTNALTACVRGLMEEAKYPDHKFGSFVLNIEMRIEP